MFQAVTNRTLITLTKELISKERLPLSELIAHLAECDERRLYADEGFPSMFSFLVDGLKYSEPAASRRLSAARLSRRFPQILCMIENGDLHLTGLHLISSHINNENGDRLIKCCIGKSKRAIEEILVSEVGRSRPIRGTVKLVPPVIDTARRDDKSARSSQTATVSFDFGDVEVPALQPNPKPSAGVHISLTLDKASFEKLKRAQSITGAESMADIVSCDAGPTTY